MLTSSKQSSLYKRKIHTAPVYDCDPETNPDLQSDPDLAATEFDPTMQSNKSPIHTQSLTSSSASRSGGSPSMKERIN